MSDSIGGDWWMVVRRYRAKCRVLGMYRSKDVAEQQFRKEAEVARDGDVALVYAPLDLLTVTSGGYNRTRW